ncbi:MAG: hypothetical protein NTU43_03155 [Bacteroidetes bacterium]|nr:hypothetical protein [Bacteroidota bacterium]
MNFNVGIQNNWIASLMRFNKLQLPQNSFYFSYYSFDSLKNAVLLFYLFLITILIGVIVIEIKHMYNIDIFPNIDTPFDNIYYESLPNCIDSINYK